MKNLTKINNSLKIQIYFISHQNVSVIAIFVKLDKSHLFLILYFCIIVIFQ